MVEEQGRRVVVVDGSNLATEGRTSPSLQQLDEAVRAFAAEEPDAEIVVVVDATFEHRIDRSERAQLTEAELHGEVVSPPAGAIGRGDAFVLRIAERTGARVLSNDSFQEFHAQHPWLFDEGRLLGGKPVPGVGWIFTPRRPVRGPTSKEVVGKARRAAAAEAALSAPLKAAELAKAARKAEKRAAKGAAATDGAAPKIGDVRRPGDRAASTSGGGKKAKKGDVAATAAEPAEEVPAKKAPAKKSAMAASEAPAKKGAAKKAPAKRAATAQQGEVLAAVPAPTAAAKKTAAKKTAAKKAVAKKAATQVEGAQPEKKTAAKQAPAKKAAANKAASKKTAEEMPAGESPPAEARTEPAAARPSSGSTGRAAGRDDPVVRRAIDDAIAEVVTRSDEASEGEGAKKASREQRDGKKQKKARDEAPPSTKRSGGRGNPPPAVNEPLAFITFVAAYPLATEVEGEVAAFTSHGAMVDVGLPEGGTLHCYIPLSAMGDPPPVKARQVLTRGERRSFVLVGLDPLRRVAELALPGTPSAASGSTSAAGTPRASSASS